MAVQACRQWREWEINVASGQPVNISVNLSARQFAHARLVNDIQDALRETGVDPSRLQLEMTESLAASAPRLTITVLAHLKHMGTGVILDHFGTGSSALSGLRQFPVDAVKIDRSRDVEGIPPSQWLDWRGVRKKCLQKSSRQRAQRSKY
ncbi:MAG TPA: EAL domain-containing protein [Candidatus Sulfotelmatobacter sp.]|nr:EAL domain-containing protein [Candidatus Sulfotelmatobacter sp.]